MQIAVEKFSEATVGYRENMREIAEKWVQLFSTPYFVVTPVSTVHYHIYLIQQSLPISIMNSLILFHANISLTN